MYLFYKNSIILNIDNKNIFLHYIKKSTGKDPSISEYYFQTHRKKSDKSWVNEKAETAYKYTFALCFCRLIHILCISFMDLLTCNLIEYSLSMRKTYYVMYVVYPLHSKKWL